MMTTTQFGEERETTNLDDSGSTLTLIKKIRGYEVANTYKQYSIRIKVNNTKEEMAEYLKYTETLRDKREQGVLVIKQDANLQPAFLIDYPKKDIDGSYFVLKTWTEYTK